MEGEQTSGMHRDEFRRSIEPAPPVVRRKRWTSHAAHERISAPSRPATTLATRLRPSTEPPIVPSPKPSSEKPIVLDGSRGEGGGQILRSALSLSLLTGRPFRITKIRANRDKPGLRPQHLRAVEAAAMLGGAEVNGAEVGSRDVVFRPSRVEPRDMSIDVGTAGSTSLILQTLHPPIAMKAESGVRVVLTGGTFNPKAPPFPFLDQTWRERLAGLGMPIALAMPSAGFYPRGGGRLEAWIEPAKPRPLVRTTRGDLVRIRGAAGVANLRPEIARRLRDRAIDRIREQGWDVDVEIELVEWPSPGQGAAISLTAEHAGTTAATFVGVGERGKPAELVADEAVAELVAFLNVPDGAVDPHSADQILLPLALAEGRSVYTVSEVTEHLRTNAATLRAFLDRKIVVEESVAPGQPGRVIVE